MRARARATARVSPSHSCVKIPPPASLYPFHTLLLPRVSPRKERTIRLFSLSLSLVLLRIVLLRKLHFTSILLPLDSHPRSLSKRGTYFSSLCSHASSRAPFPCPATPLAFLPNAPSSLHLCDCILTHSLMILLEIGRNEREYRTLLMKFLTKRLKFCNVTPLTLKLAQTRVDSEKLCLPRRESVDHFGKGREGWGEGQGGG